MILILLILIIAIIVTLKRWKERRISTIVYGMLALIFGFMPVFTSLLEIQQPYNAKIIEEGNIIVLVTLIFLYIGESAVYRIHNADHQRTFVHRTILKEEQDMLMWITYLVSTLGFVYLIFGKSTGFLTMIMTPRMDLRLGEQGSLESFANYAAPLSMIAVYLSIRNNKMKVIVWTTIVFGIFASIAYGGRYYILYTISPLLYYYLLRGTSKIKSVFIIAFIVIIFAVGVVGFLHVLRWQDERNLDTIVRLVQTPETYEFLFANQDSDMNIRYNLYKAITLFPDRSDWLYGNTYRTLFLFWIPSSVLSGLKMDTMYLFAYAESGDRAVFNEKLSDHPTLIGDLYINFGYFFVFGAFLWGCVLGLLDRAARIQGETLLGIIIGSVGAYFLILVVRGSIYQPFMTLMSLLAFVIAALIVIRFFNKEHTVNVNLGSSEL